MSTENTYLLMHPKTWLIHQHAYEILKKKKEIISWSARLMLLMGKYTVNILF